MVLRRIGLPELVVVLVVFVLVVYPAARICRKAGYSSWWGVLYILPIANVVWVWYLAFADWPALRGSQVALGGPAVEPQ